MTASLIELLVLLKPLAPLHLGQGGDLALGEDRIRSDTLWSALATVALEQRYEALFKTLLGPGFFISSSFPVWRNLPFWPRPYLRVETSGDPGQRKKWRQVAFVSDGVFQRLLKPAKAADIDFEETVHLPEGCLLLKEELRKMPACDWLQGLGNTTGNVVDRLTAMADLFDRTDLHVNTAAEVRLGVRVRLPEDARRDLETAIAELGRRGIGGERSSGKGAFEVADISPCAKPIETPDTGRLITLSLYHPTENEVRGGILEKASYDLEVRGGWVDRSGVQKKRLRMLREGSVLAVPNGQPLGDVVDVRPEGFSRPVYRYGRAFTFPLEET